MGIFINFFSRNSELPYVEDYYTNASFLSGYVIVIAHDKIVYGPDISRSHDKGLEALLYQIDPNFSGYDLLNGKIIWNLKQEEGYVLFRLTKLDLSVVYMPDSLSNFQYEMVIDIINQMCNYVNKKGKNIKLVVSDLSQGELVLSLPEFRNYLDSRMEHIKRL